MNQTPFVSIILPACNSEKTVGDAIVSVLLQTYANWELLFIDDGSTDATVEVAKKFVDSRIKIYADGTNKGLPARLNEGIDKSNGKYIARMDHDDMCYPDRLRKQVEYLEAHPVIDLLGTRAIIFLDSGEATGLFPFRQTHADICSQPWNGFYLAHPTWVGRAAWFKAYRYRTPEVKRAEDQELLLRSYPTSCFACLPEVLFAYRLRSRISLRINKQARKSLLQIQISEFARRAQWLNLVLAVFVYGAKIALDYYLHFRGATIKRPTDELEEQIARWVALKSQIAAWRR